MVNQNLDIIQGTTKAITLSLPSDYEFTTGDHVYLSIKENFNDTSYTIQKDITPTTGDTTVDLSLTPTETANLIENKNYLYDIQWNRTSGDKHNLVSGLVKVRLRVTEE